MIYDAVIFDLDETVCNTSSLKVWRDQHDWVSCRQNIGTTDLYPGIRDILLFLTAAKVPIGFVTNSPRPYATQVLQYHKIPYNALIAYHDCSRHKPDPKPMTQCADQLGRKNYGAILAIGDDIKDIQAAKNAGMIAVGVTWGIGNADAFADDADRVFDNPSQLLQWMTLQD